MTDFKGQWRCLILLVTFFGTIWCQVLNVQRCSDPSCQGKSQISNCVTKCKFIDKYVKKMTFENIPLLFLSAMNSPFALPRFRFVLIFLVVFKILTKKLYLRWKSLNKITKQSSIFFNYIPFEQFQILSKDFMMSKL